MTTAPKPITEVDALIAAWRELYPHEATDRPGDAGARAQLRRAATPGEAELEPAFHDLLLRMKDLGFDFKDYGKEGRRYLRLALVAGLLAGRLDGSSGKQRLMQVLGGQGDPAKHRLKPLRFQALIGALDRGDLTDIMIALRGALMMAKDSAFNVRAFAEDVLNWNERSRRTWTYDYFGNPFNPDQSASLATSTEETAA